MFAPTSRRSTAAGSGALAAVRTGLILAAAILAAAQPAATFGQSSPAAAASQPAVPSQPATSQPARAHRGALAVYAHGSESGQPRRLLKHFDFDERQEGNVESVPMYWLQRKGQDLPHYNSGRFDWEVGHEGKPAFRLEFITGSVAYTYVGPHLMTEPGARYLVSAWVRTQALRYSRAYLSAAFATRDGRAIPGTEVFSHPVGGEGQNAKWWYVELPLGEVPPAARFLQITVWLAQPRLWQAHSKQPRPIRPQDIHGTAWFDDIKVFQLLPTASIRTIRDEPVFEPSQPPELLVRLLDPVRIGLVGRIQVTDFRGQVCFESHLKPPGRSLAPPERIRLEKLPAGVFTATLQALSGTQPLATQTVQFVKLPAIAPPTVSRIGVCLRRRSLQALEPLVAALDGLKVGWIKVPIWTSQSRTDQIAQGDPLLEVLLGRVISKGISVVGCLEAAPADLVGSFSATRRNLVDLFLAKPQFWQPHLALSLTRYADVVRVWHFGPDRADALALDARYPTAAAAAMRQIASFVDGAEGVLPWPAVQASPPLPANVKRLSLFVPAAVPPEQIPAYLRKHSRNGAYPWVYIEPLPASRYAPDARRADLAKRIVYALAAKADAVWLPEPWRIKRADGKALLVPGQDYPVIATISRALAGKRYAGRFEWNDGAVFQIFAAGETATLIAWNDQARPGRPQGARISLYLGEKAAAYDLRGRSVALSGQEKQTLAVDKDPIIVTGAETWLARLRSRFEILPKQIPSSMREHRHQLRLVNTYPEPISGLVRLRGPEGWQIRPSRIPISLQPGQALQQPIALRLPSNEPAGTKTLYAEIKLDARRVYWITVPVALELTLPGIDSYAFADPTDTDVIIRQVLTNRTGEEINFTGFAVLPDMVRQERLFLHVQPGQTLIKEYVLPREQLDGQRKIRLGLREINGPRILNQIVQLP